MPDLNVSHKMNDLKVSELVLRTETTENVKILMEKCCPIGSTAVAYTDDLQMLAIGQENGSVQLLENGEETQLLYDSEMMQESQPCTDIKVRASSKMGFHKSLLVTYLGGHIKLWDTKIGKCMLTIKEKRDIYGVNYHPKFGKFITFGNDFKLCLYDEERRATERILACSEVFGSKNGHTNSVCSAKFHPKNPFEIISGGMDGTIQFWDLRAPFAVRNISDIVQFGEALDISHDGKMILAGVSDNESGVIRMYEYETGAKIKEKYLFNTHVYCCKFLTPEFIGIGGFINNSFLIVNINNDEILSSMRNLPSCVMSFALKRVILQQKTHNKEIPAIVISSGEKVYELGAWENEEKKYKSSDFD